MPKVSFSHLQGISERLRQDRAAEKVAAAAERTRRQARMQTVEPCALTIRECARQIESLPDQTGHSFTGQCDAAALLVVEAVRAGALSGAAAAGVRSRFLSHPYFITLIDTIHADPNAFGLDAFTWKSSDAISQGCPLVAKILKSEAARLDTMLRAAPPPTPGATPAENVGTCTLDQAANATSRTKGTVSKWAKDDATLVAQRDPHGRASLFDKRRLMEVASDKARRESAAKAERRMNRPK